MDTSLRPVVYVSVCEGEGGVGRGEGSQQAISSPCCEQRYSLGKQGKCWWALLYALVCMCLCVRGRGEKSWEGGGGGVQQAIISPHPEQRCSLGQQGSVSGHFSTSCGTVCERGEGGSASNKSSP